MDALRSAEKITADIHSTERAALQKIHYIETLKVQLQNLMDENTKLKEGGTVGIK
jgi:hypothetical protein